MAGLKNKISNLIHKDKADTTDTSSTSSTPKAKDYLAGHVAPTSTGALTGSSTSTGPTATAGTAGLAGTGTGTSSTTGTGTGTGTGTSRAKEEVREGLSDLSLGGKRGTTSTTGATTATTYGEGSGDVYTGTTRSVDSTTHEIIDSKHFTKTEDHEVLIEKKAYELEHRPVQKKYVVETRFLGERAVPGKATELLSTETREVEERIVNLPHGDRQIIIENVDIGTEKVIDGHRVILPHTHKEPHTTKFPVPTGTDNKYGTSASTPATGTTGTSGTTI